MTTKKPLAECMLLERVTLTGISKAMLRFLFQDRTPTYLAALIFVPVPILSYIKLLVAGHMMRLISVPTLLPFKSSVSVEAARY